MKKLFLILTVALLTMSANAQIKLGIRGGVDVSNTSGNAIAESVKNPSKAGFYIGPTIRVTPLPVFGVDLSALYTQRNTDIDGFGVKQQAIALPLNLRYQVSIPMIATLSVFAGPQVSFNLNNDDNKNLKETIGDWTWKTSNLSANVGVSALLLKHFEVMANYNFALGKTGEFDSFKSGFNELTSRTDRKVSSFQVGVGYYF